MLEGTTIGDMRGDTGNLDYGSLGVNPAESLFTAEVMKGLMQELLCFCRSLRYLAVEALPQDMSFVVSSYNPCIAPLYSFHVFFPFGGVEYFFIFPGCPNDAARSRSLQGSAASLAQPTESHHLGVSPKLRYHSKGL